MKRYRIGVLAAWAALAACAPPPEEAGAPAGTPADSDTVAAAPAAADSQAATQMAALHCTPSDRMAVAGRASAYDSTALALGDESALVCYGRPAAKGRTVFGELVPYGKLWRTGANEPTIIHLPFAAVIAGIQVEPGSYSLYTVPGQDEWTVIVNRSTSQWGHESTYTPEVQAQEVGRATVKPERLDSPVETFTIRSEPSGPTAGALILEWENTRVRIPVTRR
jgi:hypothetical protein